MIGISGLVADKNFRDVTDPDIVATLQDLKKLPDNVLTGYAQNPNDPKQTYALSVLISRKNAKEEAATQPQTTVKDDVIASISEPPKSYAGGGIVAFAGEGGSYVTSPLDTLASNQPAPQGIGAPGPTPEQLTKAGGVTTLASNVGRNYAGGGIVAFAGEGGSYVTSPNARPYTGSNIIPLSKEQFDKLDPASQEKYLRMLDFEKKISPKKLQDVEAKPLLPSEIIELPKMRFGDLTERGQVMPPERVSNKDELLEEKQKEKDLLSKKPTSGFTKEDIFNNENASLEDMIAGGVKSPDSLNEFNRFIDETKTSEDIEKLLTVNREDSDKIAKSVGIDLNTLKDKRTLDEFATEVKGNYEKMGVDPSMFKAIGEDVKSQKDLLKGEIGRAADMALIEAGLLIAGGESSNALSNVAKATPAIQNYIKNLSNLRGEEREIAKFELTIASAESAMKMGMADKALALYSKAQDNIADIEKAKLSTEAKIKLDNLTLRTNTSVKQLLTNQQIRAQFGLQGMKGQAAIDVANITKAGSSMSDKIRLAGLQSDYGKEYDELSLRDDPSVKGLTRAQYITNQMRLAGLSNLDTSNLMSTTTYSWDPSIYQQ